MDQHKEAAYWKKRKAEVERAVKVLTQKREKTLYLYRIEKESRRKIRELQLRTLLGYETKELHQALAGLQSINAKITALESEQKKHNNVKLFGWLSLFMVVFAFAGLIIHHNQGENQEMPEIPLEESSISWASSWSDKIAAFLKKYSSGNNALTGAVVGVPNNNCHEEKLCANETVTKCKNETIQKCDSVCVNETKQNCVEECKPECHLEEINGVGREVCVKKCSDVCTEEVVQNCGSCVDVVEEKCSSGIIERCSIKMVCDETIDSNVTGGVTADIVEEVPAVGIQPIKEEIPADAMTGGTIAIPEPEPALEIPPIAEESPELGMQPIIEEPITEIPEEPVVENPPAEEVEMPVEENAPIEEDIPEVTEPTAENATETEEAVEEGLEVAPMVEVAEEKSIFSSIIDSIIETIFPEDLTLFANAQVTRLLLNTTYVTQGNSAVNLTAYATLTDASQKAIYNWLRNGSSVAVLNMPFEGGSLSGNSSGTTNGAKDYTPFSYNGSVYNAFWNSSGGYDHNGSFEFVNAPASPQFINITDNGNLDIGTNDFTMMAWIRTNISASGGGGLMRILSKRDTAGRGYQFELDGSAQNILRVSFFLGDGTVSAFGGAASPTDLAGNKWHHVAITFDRDTAATYYVDGVPDGSPPNRSISAAQGSLANSLNLLVGTNNPEFAAGNGFNGTIDELMIFNRSLSAQQVYAIWRNQSNVMVNQEVNKGDKWTVQATPNNGTGDGAMLEQSVIIYPAVIQSFTLNSTNITANDTSVNLTAYTSTADPDGDSVKVIYNWLRNGTSIAVLNMPFEGVNGSSGNNAWDYSGYLNNATIQGADWIANGGFDGRGTYNFTNNENQGINISPRETLDVNQTTYAVWINLTDTTPGYLGVITKGDENRRPFSLFTTANKLEIWYSIDKADSARLATDVVFEANKWYHIAATYGTDGNLSIYINGTLHKSTTERYGPDKNTTHPLHIGFRRSGAYLTFKGRIDDVLIFNRSLSHQQIRALYENKTWMIVPAETARGENWSVQATPNDGTKDGAMVISNNVTIANTPPPAPILLNLTNGSTITSRTPTLSWNVSEDTADGDVNITYRIEIDDNIAFNNPEVNVSGIANTTLSNVSYTLSTELGVDTSFFWRVFAYDGMDFSVMSATRNFTIQSLLSVNVTADNATFGTFNIGQNVNTPANASSLRAENIGNVVANITVTGTSLFTAVGMPSTFYRFKIRANESSAFNTTASATEWNQTNSTLNEFVFHVVNLDWHSVSNDFLLDLNISVPGDETPGSKASTLTFTITG